MKVGMRMTVATSAVVALTLAIYAFFDLRSSRAERVDALEHNLEGVALALRYQVESRNTEKVVADATRQAQKMSDAVAPLRVSILPALSAIDAENNPQAKRIKAFTEAKSTHLVSRDEGALIYALPLRASSQTQLAGFEILGVLEVSADTRFLDQASRDDMYRSLGIMGGVVVTVFLAMLVLSRSLVTDPISKLLTGVDDVAHGDLSRVLLAEREDEIGDLAARFNEMTYSLRESRNETQRTNESRAALEQRLFQTEKLATIGQIAAEIAHEVGTPLNVISGRAKGMQKKAKNPEAVEKNARIIAEQSARITKIIQRLLDFSRRKVGVEEDELVNLNLLTLNTMEFLHSKLSAAHVRHNLNRAEALPPVKGNPDQLLQVLTNLVLNAIEAMSKDGGKLDVETAEVIRRRPGLEVAPQMPTVVISVSDTGPGIPEADRDKIFEPFYSSKTGEGGTGLGLAVVHGIVKAHDGWIEVSDSPSGGSCFSVYFPAAEAAS